jgi:hypothetical protein
MAYTYKDLQDEVKRRATKNQGGTQFDTAIKNIINTSLFRIAMEATWRPLRRRTQFTTKTNYTTGSGAGTFTNGSSTITVTGATFITDGIEIGRKINLGGDSVKHTIKTITGETTLTIEEGYGGTSTTTGTYTILPQEQYNLPIQSSHRMFMWHEEWGFPYEMFYQTDQDFYNIALDVNATGVPTIYRMWGEDMVIKQLLEPSVITIVSSDSSDTSVPITIFGTVSGYPDFEIINTNSSNGTTSAAGSKSFSSIERVSKGSSTTGRITATANSGNTTVAVMPVGDTTAGIMYRKVQLWQLPSTAFEMQVQYYKTPYRLVNDNDIHELGQDFDEAIILLSTAKIKYESNQNEGDKFMGMFKDEMRVLRRTNLDKIDWIPRLKRRRESRGHLNRNTIGRGLQYRQIGSFFGPATRT